MAQYSRITVVQKMGETRIIPVFYHHDTDVCISILKACYEGGIRVFEFTNRGDYAHEVFTVLQHYIQRELPGMILGIGSVCDAATAALYLQMGANFVVSPVVNPEVAKVCNRRKAAWLPGCGSVSEISQAEELGAEVVKLFPAMQVGGPGFIKAVKGPMHWSSIMPTGGVEPDQESLRSWFEAGAFCVGVGSSLFKTLPDGTYDLATIKHNVAAAVAFAESL